MINTTPKTRVQNKVGQYIVTSTLSTDEALGSASIIFPTHIGNPVNHKLCNFGCDTDLPYIACLSFDEMREIVLNTYSKLKQAENISTITLSASGEGDCVFNTFNVLKLFSWAKTFFSEKEVEIAFEVTTYGNNPTLLSRFLDGFAMEGLTVRVVLHLPTLNRKKARLLTKQEGFVETNISNLCISRSIQYFPITVVVPALRGVNELPHDWFSISNMLDNTGLDVQVIIKSNSNTSNGLSSPDPWVVKAMAMEFSKRVATKLDSTGYIYDIPYSVVG